MRRKYFYKNKVFIRKNSEGKIVTKLELARELLDDETIANKTKLPLEQVKKLRQETLKDMKS